MTSICAALITQNCIAGNFDSNLSQTIDIAGLAAKQGAKIVVFPEMNLTGYLTGEEILSISRPLTTKVTAPLKKMSKRLGITLLAGLAERTNDYKIFATHLVFTPDGVVKYYRKTHTAPFEKKHFSAGNSVKVFHSQGLCFGIQLCYDAHFPELSLAMALKGVDVIFIPHASPRGSGHDKYMSWLRHLTARAFDNGVYIAACNQTGSNQKGLQFPGISLIIGPDGKVKSHEIDGKPGIHMVDIDIDFIKKIQSHQMRYFLPNRRNDLFDMEKS